MIEFMTNYAAPISFLCCLPLAVIWSKVFRSTGYNFVEKYVFALYLFAQIDLFELALLPVSIWFVNEDILSFLFLVLFTIYFVFAAGSFYQLKPVLVLFRLTVSIFYLFVILMVLRLIAIPVWPLEGV